MLVPPLDLLLLLILFLLFFFFFFFIFTTFVDMDFLLRGILQKAQMVSRFHDFTGLEFIDFWLQSIYTYAAATGSQTDGEFKKQKESPPDKDSGALPKHRETKSYKSPPILIVGTHRGDPSKQVACISFEITTSCTFFS